MKTFAYGRALGRLIALVGAVFLSQVNFVVAAATNASQAERKLLYVAVPGIRNYLEYGGHGVLIFDIDYGHRFVKRIPAAGLGESGQPLNVKGVCANASTKRLYVGTTRTLTCFDLPGEKIIWEKPYPGGCDRMSITPDGKVIYLPSLEGAHWHVVDALTGEVIKKIVPKSMGAALIWLDCGRHCSRWPTRSGTRSFLKSGRSATSFDPSPSTVAGRSALLT